MIINHYKRPISIFTTLVLTLALVILNRYIPFERDVNVSEFPFTKFLVHTFSSQSLIHLLTIFLFANLVGFISYIINDKFIILNKRSYYPYFISASLLVAGPYMQRLSGAHFSVIFVFAALYNVLRISDSKNKTITVINASFLLALGSFIQFQTLFLLPVIWFAAGIQKSLDFRMFQASLAGAALPYIIVLGYMYVFSSVDLIIDPLPHVFTLSSWHLQVVPEGFWLLFIGTTLFVIIGFVSFLRYRERLNTISRKSMEIFMFLMFLNFIYFGIGLLPLQSSLIYSSLSAGIVLSGLWVRINHKPKRLLYYTFIILLFASFILKF